MTHGELTALWREAGCPWVQGMQCGSYVVDAVCDGRPYVDDGEYALEGDPTPDWGHPMTEFALMCAAEQAAGEAMCWEELAGQWSCLPVSSAGGLLDTYPTRIEAALNFIIERREAGDAAR